MHLPVRLAVVVLPALFALPLAAQQRWLEPAMHVRQAVDGRYLVVTAADIDGDGDEDLVWAGRDGDRVQRNHGAGLFGEPDATLVPSVPETSMLLFFDADGDGDLDLLRGRGTTGGQTAWLYTNDGTGRFTDVSAGQLPAPAGALQDAVAGDCDGDGDLDLVLALSDRLALYFNDGSGRFTDGSANRLPSTPAFALQLALRDLDGDGDRDLALANTAGDSQYGVLSQNDGAGRFTDVTATQYRSIWSPRARDVAAGDLDGDGDADLILVDAFSLVVLANDGSGGFSAPASSTIPGLRSNPVALRCDDVDRDGDLDVFFLYSRAPAMLWRNDGAWRFTDVSSSVNLSNRAWTDAAFRDFDGDGDRDLLLASQLGHSELHASDGQGRFTLATPYALPETSGGGSAVAAGDLDGDGDVDLVTGRLAWLRNDGEGRFTSHSFGTVALRGLVDVVDVADVDGDGDLDVFAGMRDALPPQAQSRLWRNDGLGNLTEVGTLPRVAQVTRDAVFHDVDRDGDQDLLLANDGAEAFWRNNGAGQFVDASAALPANAAATTTIRAGDLDRDGDVDVVTADGGGGLRLWLGNPGATQFTDASARLPLVAGAQSVAIDDLDADGDLDLAAGALGTGVVWLRNDGAGNFALVAGGIRQGLVQCDRLLAADVDRDGDLDLLGARFEVGLRTLLLRNDGTGTFADASALLPRDEGMMSIAAADVDQDGDVDVIPGSPSNGLRLYLDLARQAQIVLPPRIGRLLAIDVWHRPGFAPSLAVAGILVAPGRARIAVPPFGVLGCDPATMFAVGVFPIAAPGGRVTPAFPLPGDPALVGIPFVTQALMIDSVEARLTNADGALIR